MGDAGMQGDVQIVCNSLHVFGDHLLALVYPDLIWYTSIGLFCSDQERIMDDITNGESIGDIIGENCGGRYAPTVLHPQRQFWARLFSFSFYACRAQIFYQNGNFCPIDLIDDDCAIESKSIGGAKCITVFT